MLRIVLSEVRSWLMDMVFEDDGPGRGGEGKLSCAAAKLLKQVIPIVSKLRRRSFREDAGLAELLFIWNAFKSSSVSRAMRAE